MEDDNSVHVNKFTVKVEHPDNEYSEFVLEDVLVIPPDGNWSAVPNLEKLAEGTSAVLLNFRDFTKLVLGESGEQENYQPFTLN